MIQTRLRDLFWTFLKIGVFTFGGGYAMISLIEREIIEKKQWLPKGEFTDLLTIAQSAPGPIALNTAVFIGFKTRGYKGALAAIFGVVIPSFLILLLVAIYFAAIKDNAIIAAAFNGMRPAVIALIVAPMISLARPMSPQFIVLAIVLAGVMWYFAISPIYPLIASAAVGVVWGYRMTKRLK